MKSRSRTPNARLSCSCTGTPYADCLIAEDENGQPCAYCLLALTWSNEAGGLCVWLEEIMVDDEQRGKGIGSRIMPRCTKNTTQPRGIVWR